MIDNGTSFHVTSYKELFTSYISYSFGMLKMCNDGLAHVVNTWDACLGTSIKTQLTIEEVQHAHKIYLNLILINKFNDKGFCNTFNEAKWKLNKGSLVVAQGKRSFSLYLMQTSFTKVIVNVKKIKICQNYDTKGFVTWVKKSLIVWQNIIYYLKWKVQG